MLTEWPIPYRGHNYTAVYNGSIHEYIRTWTEDYVYNLVIL